MKKSKSSVIFTRPSTNVISKSGFTVNSPQRMAYELNNNNNMLRSYSNHDSPFVCHMIICFLKIKKKKESMSWLVHRQRNDTLSQIMADPDSHAKELMTPFWGNKKSTPSSKRMTW